MNYNRVLTTFQCETNTKQCIFLRGNEILMRIRNINLLVGIRGYDTLIIDLEM